MGKSKKKKRNDARGYGATSGGNKQKQQGQQPLAASSKDVVVTKQTHEGIQSLVDRLRLSETKSSETIHIGSTERSSNNNNNNPALATADSTIRFVPKLTKIVDRLIDLGFEYDPCKSARNESNRWYLEEMVAALGYGITLESALDWLCLNVPTLELPPLFTDGNLRNNLMQEGTQQSDSNGGNSSSLTVLKFVSSSSKSLSQLQSQSQSTTPADASKSKRKEEEKKKKESERQKEQQKQQQERMIKIRLEKQIAKEKAEAEEREAAKKKLLEQYAEYHDDDSDGDENEDKGVGNGDSAASGPESPMSPQEAELLEKEKELRDLEADLGCEANNYMRSKQETRVLSNQVKTVKQQVAGLRRKAEKIQRQREQEQREQDQAEEEIAEEDESGGGFFCGGGGFFDDDGEEEDDDEEAPVESSKTADAGVAASGANSKTLLECTIPKGWTGTTPRKTLEDNCRKQKLGKPKFLDLGRGPSGGYKLSGINVRKGKKANTSSNNSKTDPSTKDEWIALSENFVKGSSLPDYLALQALYEIDSNKPLYGLFPPAFRSLWLSWLEDAKQEKDQVQKVIDEKKKTRVQKLLGIVESNHRTDATAVGITSSSNNSNNNNSIHGSSSSLPSTDPPQGNTTAHASEESWEDMSGDEGGGSKLGTKRPSKAGASLKREFVQRQSTKPYADILQQRENLPMTSYRSEVLQTIRKHQVMILCAETGAGKTTQCPQYLLEEALLVGLGDKVNIICTQPRRVAATSVAERVAEEMNDRLGNQVGYQIRMEAKRSKNTKLLFCTTGVILRRLQDDRSLKSITHVIVDEVHERQVQTDVLLIALRQLLRTTRRDLKVILMSATLDSNLFSNFFDQAPVIKVPGRTFPVANYFLEDLLDATGHIIEEGSRYAFREYHKSEKKTLWVSSQGGEKHREVVDLAQRDTEVSDLYSGYSMSTRLSLERVDESVLNFDLIEDVLQILLIHPERNSTLMAPDGADTSNGSVLVFLPGIGEIRALTDRLSANRTLGKKSKFSIIPLHSKLSSADQRKAFLPVKAGCRKIILSTNIAETSVTIQDVVVVIDCGREREVRRNKRTSTSILVTDWCSKANAKQRAGRAGRVQPGLCLKLFSSGTAESLKKTSEPELKRVPLEEVCLSILASGLGKDCYDFLLQAPQPPSDDSILAALDVLEEVGAITSDRKFLTPLGQHLAKLPVDVRLGKMLVLGSLFQCLDKVLTIAASLSSKSPFSTSLQNAEIANAKHRQFKDLDSDFATLCNVWEGYSDARSKSNKAGRSYCQSNFLNPASMHEIASARRDFFNLLSGIGFVGKGGSSPTVFGSDAWKKSDINRHSNDSTLVHAVVFAGLNPNVARLEESRPGSYTLWNKDQQIHFHRTSVNASKKRFSRDQNWVVFFEKFGTPSRTSVSTTCFVGSMPLLLFGGPLVVKHTDRIVIINDWMEIEMAAQIGVMLKELRVQVENLLLRLIVRNDEVNNSNNNNEKHTNSSSEGKAVITSIVDILSHTTSTR